MKSFVITILLGLSFFTALMLESNMGTHFAIELVLILIGTILMAGIIFGFWIEEPWAYPLTTIVFAAALINLVWLFYSTNAFLTFAFGLLVNVAGLVMCLVGIERAMDFQELETYETGTKRKK
jgi:uncharacterized membrane protein